MLHTSINTNGAVIWALSRLWEMPMFFNSIAAVWGCVCISLYVLLLYMYVRRLVVPFGFLLARYLPIWAAAIIALYTFCLGSIALFHLVFSLVILCRGEKYYEPPLPRSFYSLFK